MANALMMSDNGKHERRAHHNHALELADRRELPQQFPSLIGRAKVSYNGKITSMSVT